MQCMFMWDQLNKTHPKIVSKNPKYPNKIKKPRSKMHEMHEEWEKEEEKKNICQQVWAWTRPNSWREKGF